VVLILKRKDETLFADIKNKHNTMNSSSSEALFQKLARYADTYKKSKCYWVQILAKIVFANCGKVKLMAKNTVIVEFTKFLATNFTLYFLGKKMLCFNCKKLPIAINDYLNSIENKESIEENSALDEIKSETETSKRSILDQITFENYSYYLGFDKL
jgi:hypothetical protein